MPASSGLTTTIYSWLVQLAGPSTALGTQDVLAVTNVAASSPGSEIYLSFQGNPTAGASVGLVDGNTAETASYTGFFGSDANGNNSGPIVEIGNAYYLLANSAYVVSTSAPLASNAYVLDNAQSLCLIEGTAIATPRGPRAIETLAPGDLVITSSGTVRPIRWVGHEAINGGLTRDEANCPIRIAADSFGAGLPNADLWLSPDHAVFSDGALIPARCLVNGASIAHVARDEFTYWHISLDTHDVILAHGLPVESLLADVDSLAGFDNGTTAPMPDLFAAPCAPVMTQGPIVERVRARLAMQPALAA